MIWLTIALAILCVICAAGWVANALALRALTHMLKQNGCTPTTERNS